MSPPSCHRRLGLVIAERDATSAGIGLVAEAITGDTAHSRTPLSAPLGANIAVAQIEFIGAECEPLSKAGAVHGSDNPYGRRVSANESVDEHPGGGFDQPDPTTGGGADYGRFVEAVRELQDHARAANAPDEVITEAANLVEKASQLLGPYDADEWTSPSGRRMDLPNRGNILQVPADLRITEGGRVAGDAQFRRYHLGRNGAAHGGAVALLFDSMLGFTAFKLTSGSAQRTAFLHVDYRKIAPVEKPLKVDAGIDAIEGRKIFVSGRVLDGSDVLAEGHALFVKLKRGQP